jgi:hypothetical protein
MTTVRPASQPTPQPAPGYWSPNVAPRLGTGAGQRVNYMAWTGLLVSVSGFLFNFGVNGIVGIIFSILGLREARRLADAGQSQTGRQLAVAGIITGIAHIIVTAGIVVLSVLAYFWFTDWINDLTTQIENSNLSSRFSSGF